MEPRPVLDNVCRQLLQVQTSAVYHRMCPGILEQLERVALSEAETPRSIRFLLRNSPYTKSLARIKTWPPVDGDHIVRTGLCIAFPRLSTGEIDRCISVGENFEGAHELAETMMCVKEMN